MLKMKPIVRVFQALRLLLVLAFLAGACAPQPSMRGPQKLDDKYEQELQRWTSSGRIDDSLDRILVVHASYLDLKLRKVFGDQYRNIFGTEPDEVDSDLEMIATSAGRGHEFFLFADVTKESWNNFDEKDSVWRLTLWGGDKEQGVAPISVERFRGRGPNLAAFFPYLNRFGHSYLVIFPAQHKDGSPVLAEDGLLHLKLSSAFGTVSMSWKVNQ